VVDPVKGLSVAVDWWKINVNNLVTTLSPSFTLDQAAAGNPAYTGLVTRDSANNITSIVGTNINAGSVKTEGVDLDLRWAMLKSPTYGNFNLRLNGTYTSKYDLTLPDGTVQRSVAATIDKDGNVLSAVSNGGIIFRWKDQLSLDWKHKKLGRFADQQLPERLLGRLPRGCGRADRPARRRVLDLGPAGYLWRFQEPDPDRRRQEPVQPQAA
jgi:iron complex outermembrane receptor protein